MKHRLLFTLLLGGMAIGSYAQKDYTILEDLTSSKLTNSNFSADQPVTATIYTYDDNMPDNGVGSGDEGAIGLFGMQPVTGWTASHPTDNTMVSTGHSDSERRTDGLNAKAAGVFAFDDESGENELPGLGGAYYAPYQEAGYGLSGNTLGMVAVWGSDISYTQDVSLPQGAYMLVMTACNQAGSGTLSSNNFGYIVDDETSYLSTKKTFTVGLWETDTVVFRLSSDTNGKVSLGLKFGDGSGTAPHLFIDNVKLYKIDETQLIQEEIDELKEELLSLIEMGSAYGVDTSASQAVYDNPNATKEQVEAAIENQKALNESGTTDLSEAFITNPHFTQDDPVEGGICTYDYDCSKNNIDLKNYSQLPVVGWKSIYTDNGRAAGVYEVGSSAFLGGANRLPPTTLSNGATEGKVLGFVTCWGQTVQYTQDVTLPAGKYTLTLSYYVTLGTRQISKNLIGFICDDGTEHLGTRTTFSVGSWVTEDVSFELAEQTTGKFSVGYTSSGGGSADNPHFFTDGIALVYIGTGIDPTFLALQSAVTTGTNLLGEKFNAELKSAFEAAVNNGQDLIDEHSSDKDANRAATSAITSQVEAVQASIESYKRLQEFYDGDLADAVDKYETTAPALYTQIAELSDEVAIALDEQTWGDEEIDTAIASLPTMIKTYVQQEFDKAVANGTQLAEDLDISILYDNLGVTYSTSALSNTSIPDKQWEYGDASNFKTQYGTAEVWNQSPFTVSQTMTDMPAGVYTLKVRAFYRTADHETNYANYNPDEEKAFIFAGKQKAALTNVYEIASTDPEEFLNSTTAAEGIYVPNNQQTAHSIFINSAYDDKLLKSVSTVLTETGDLTFGITADEMSSNSWVVWDTFELYYNAIEGNDQVVNDELQALLNVAVTYAENGCSDVLQTLTDLTDAYEQGETALDKGTLDERIAAINALKSAIAEADESAALVEELNTLRDYFNTVQSEHEYVSSDPEFESLMSQIEAGSYDSNASVGTMISDLPAAWAHFVLGQDMSQASEDNPIDITGIILNADFESGNSNYWTSDEEIGQNLGYQGASYTNEDGDVTIDKFVEAWRQSVVLNDGEIGQTLAAVLPEGYYLLEVDGHAVRQSALGTVEESISGAGLMAKVGESLNYVDMGVEGQNANPTHFVLGFYSDGKSPVTVGLHVEGTNANWLAADNFKLSYVGSEAPTGIEELQSLDDAIDFNNAVIYNLSGQRLNHVQKGINIINGKKVYIK